MSERSVEERLEQRLKLISPDGSNVKFELARFGWIGTPVQELIEAKLSGVRVEDAAATFRVHHVGADGVEIFRTRLERMYLNEGSPIWGQLKRKVPTLRCGGGVVIPDRSDDPDRLWWFYGSGAGLAGIAAGEVQGSAEVRGRATGWIQHADGECVLDADRGEGCAAFETD